MSDMIKTILRLRNGDNNFINFKRNHIHFDNGMNHYCPSHHPEMTNSGFCPNCFYDKDGNSLVVKRILKEENLGGKRDGE